MSTQPPVFGQNPYQSAPPPSGVPMAPLLPRQSNPVGLISFILGILSLFLEVAAFGTAMFLAITEPTNIDSRAGSLAVVGLLAIGGLGLALVGGALGLVAVCLPNRVRGLALTGLILNGLVFCGFGGLALLGMIMSARPAAQPARPVPIEGPQRFEIPPPSNSP